jgi:hypothetical protein
MRHSLILSLIAVLFCGHALMAEPLERKAEATKLQPFTFENVRSFFQDILRVRPTKVQKRCVIFYEGEFKNANTYDYCVIIVENSDEDLQVTFYITDDKEMNWVNEFIEGPFFTRAESEKVYGLLHREKHARGTTVGRFRVDVSHWEPRHAEIIVLSFTPLQRQRN